MASQEEGSSSHLGPEDSLLLPVSSVRSRFYPTLILIYPCHQCQINLLLSYPNLILIYLDPRKGPILLDGLWVIGANGT